jgi:hypothetical protein
MAKLEIMVKLTGSKTAISQALAELQSNIDYDRLRVKVALDLPSMAKLADRGV